MCARSSGATDLGCPVGYLPAVRGTGFNWPSTDHLRIVTLPWAKDLTEAIGRLGNFLSTYVPPKD